MFKRTLRTVVPILVVLSLFIGACGGSEPDLPATKAPIERDVDLKGSSADPGEVSSLEDVRMATVRIEAEGTFVDPDEGMAVTWAGSGSGFVIDPSGLAVTNNHVVTGAALLRVWVADETSPRNARILGVSECADLAVIDIDGPDLPYLAWHEGDVNVGLEVYAAGFPLGDPEFTLTKGIVSKARADGESTWSSIDYVLEHDARINPGNSGGPLVDDQGRVVAVNYASIESVKQYFAIKTEDALPVIEQLRTEQDVDSIGVNGQAILSDDGSFSGIWVNSVESGSPADEAGIDGGDIVTTLEGLPLATDGTMADYCDILRTQGADDTLAVEILRFASGEVLEGQLNGRALEVTGQVSQPSGGASGGSSAGGYSSFTTFNDNTGSLEISIPSTWSEVDGSDWTDEEGAYHYSIWAAPNLDDFQNSWNTPGLIYEITPDGARYGGYLNYLNDVTAELETVCSFDGMEDYDDGLFTGAYRLYSGCGGTDTGYFVLSAYPADNPNGYSVRIEIQLLSDADWDAIDPILGSFNVVGPIGQALSGGTVSDDPYTAGGSTGGGYSSYTAVSDDYNSIVVEVPAEWRQIDGAPWTYNGDVIGAGITAAPDLDSFSNTWGTSGVEFLVSDDLANQIGYLQLLNEESLFFKDACEFDARYDYDDGYYRGKYDFFNKCGGSGGSSYMVLAAVSKTDQFDFLILVEVEIVTDADWDAAQHILDTFDVIDLLP